MGRRFRRSALGGVIRSKREKYLVLAVISLLVVWGLSRMILHLWVQGQVNTEEEARIRYYFEEMEKMHEAAPTARPSPGPPSRGN